MNIFPCWRAAEAGAREGVVTSGEKCLWLTCRCKRISVEALMHVDVCGVSKSRAATSLSACSAAPIDLKVYRVSCIIISYSLVLSALNSLWIIFVSLCTIVFQAQCCLICGFVSMASH